MRAETGEVQEPRAQWAVLVSGRIQEYEALGASFSCGCLLAPEFPKLLGKKKFWCEKDCRMQIFGREYIDCTRQEVLNYLIDFEDMPTVPKEVLDEEIEGGRTIREVQRSGSDMYLSLF